MNPGLVFDLDDTLYWERDYVRSGFKAVAASVTDSAQDADALSAHLQAGFDAGRRGSAFDDLLVAFPGLSGRTSVGDMVRTYRAHAPDVRLDPSVTGVLDELTRRGSRLGIVTDGPLVSQRAKANALGLTRWFDPIVCTDALPPGSAKPAAIAFERIEAAWGMAGAMLAYIADNPEKDFAAPRRLGWRTVRLRDPRQLRATIEPIEIAFAPETEIEHLTDLVAALTTAHAGS